MFKNSKEAREDKFYSMNDIEYNIFIKAIFKYEQEKNNVTREEMKEYIESIYNAQKRNPFQQDSNDKSVIKLGYKNTFSYRRTMDHLKEALNIQQNKEPTTPDFPFEKEPTTPDFGPDEASLL